MTKEQISEMLSKKLGEVTDAVIKKLNEQTSESPKENQPDPKDDKSKDGENSDLNKTISDLTNKVNELSSKLEKSTPAKTQDEINAEKKQALQDNLSEFVKSVGIDPNNVDVQFVIKEKKKGEIDGKSDNLDKTKSKSDDEDDDEENVTSENLSKKLESLDDAGKKEALNEFFKSAIFNK